MALSGRPAASQTEKPAGARGATQALIDLENKWRSFRKRRATRKLAERGVADVAQVGDADFAGVVAVASHVTQEGEEGNSLAERGILLGVFAESDEVERSEEHTSELQSHSDLVCRLL